METLLTSDLAYKTEKMAPSQLELYPEQEQGLEAWWAADEQ